LIILKPDTIQRGIVGELITRFERKGLKIIGLKIMQPTVEFARRHYDKDEAWCEKVGQRTRKEYKEQGLPFNYESDVDAGKAVLESLVNYLACGPVIAMVLEGGLAVRHVRNMVGFFDPIDADMGTIRADYTIESSYVAGSGERAVRNMVHASGEVDEAEEEIKLWFKPEELCNYELAIEKILYDPGWEKERKNDTGE